LRSFLDDRVFGELADGPGPLVVALHGWGRDHREFRELVSGYPHLLVDLPGFGVSPPPPSSWGAADYACCVATLLDRHAAGRQAVLVGHSFGGRVAVCLAASRPGLVRAMILCGVPLLRAQGAGKESFGYRLAKNAYQIGLLSERRFDEMRQSHGSDDYKAASGIMQKVLVRVVSESYETQLAAVRCPVGLLWGRDDLAVPSSVAEKASSLLTGGVTADVVEGAGHDVHLQAPGRLEAMVDKVLEMPGSVPRC
jgi:pimeloyl-ACP methyl ester carboxylesterase